MKWILSTVKSRYTRGISERTARLDPDERRALADEVEAALRDAPPLPLSSEGASNVPSVPPESTADGAASTATEQMSASAEGDEGCVDATDAALAELDDALARSRTKLAELERTERFVGVRCRRYKISLENRATELKRLEELSLPSARGEEAIQNEEDRVVNGSDSAATQAFEEGSDSARAEPDVEEGKTAAPKTPEELERMRDKQAKDEEALSKVIDTHTTILANVERMRRTIADLERKRDEIALGRDICHNFLVAAEEAEEAEAMGERIVGRRGCPLTPGWGGPVEAAGEGQQQQQPVVDTHVELAPVESVEDDVGR